MYYKRFKDFEADVSIMIDQEHYDEVLYLLKKAQEVLPENEYDENSFYILFIISFIYSSQNKADECISLIQAAVNQGMAFPLDFSVYNFIREHRDYRTVYQANKAALEEERRNSSFKYKVCLPEGYNADKKYPLFFSLHGDSADGNISYHSSYWRSDVMLQMGYIVVYPQSSQTYCHNGFGWLPDPLLSRKEIKDCYTRLMDEYSIDAENVIISGFSGGASAALDIAFSNTIPTKGFIALCPGDDPSQVIASAKWAAGKGMRGVILEGQYNAEPEVQSILKAFDKAGLPYKYILNKNIGHAYPEDLDEKLSDAISFINQ